MLQLLDETLEAFLRSSVPLDPNEVAIAFDAPDRQWAAGISQPTVNVFLYDIHRSADRAAAGVETLQREGRTVRRRTLPQIEVKYLLTAWTSDHRDEHSLLGDVMKAVLAARELRPPFLSPPLDLVMPRPTLELASSGGSQSSELWSAIDGQLKPSLQISIKLPVDLDLLDETAEPPATIEVETRDIRQPTRRSVRRAQLDEV